MASGDLQMSGYPMYSHGQPSLRLSFVGGEFSTGCVDSLVCGYRSTDDVLDMFRECCRVLRPSGVFLCVSRELLSIQYGTRVAFSMEG